MPFCELEHDAAALPTAPLTNGDGSACEATQDTLDIECAPIDGVGRRRRFRLSSSMVASLMLHVGALAVLASPAWRAWHRWEIRLPRGHNSEALAASVASPKSEAVTNVQITNPQAAAFAEPVARKESELPDATAAQFASAVVDRRVPLPEQERRRSDVEEPPRRTQPESTRPKRTAEARLPQRDAVVSIESPASNPSAASVGTDRDVPPQVMREVRAVYPAAARAAGMQGVVKFRVRVNNRGEVLSTVLHQSSGFELLDQAALEAILQYEFAPFEEGEGIAAEFLYPIRFRLTQ